MKSTRTKTLDRLLDIYRAALAAVAPGPVLARALQDEPVPKRVWLLALGKAAHPMARAAVDVLVQHGRQPAGGLVISADDERPPHASMAVFVGDHPEPGTRSLAAAEALEHLVKAMPAGDTVWVLLSGGTTSLVGAPQPGIAPADLAALYAQLLRSGLDIKAMNLVRKRFTRWSGGRLARSLGHAAAVRCFVVSDVVGDDLAAIASGPCVPDRSTARDVRQLLTDAGLLDALPPSLQHHLGEIERGTIPETPKPGEPAFDRVTVTVIASNRLALEAAGRRARELGLIPEIVESPLVGAASAAGEHVARRLIAEASPRPAGEAMRCVIFGGETTVTLGPRAGIGGRCQELALAAARVLDNAPTPAAILAAGTDGRDGPTDAAGAMVDESTWKQIAAAGRDPQHDLDDHNAYPALASADALIKIGLTGTNVMDVVIGVT